MKNWFKWFLGVPIEEQIQGKEVERKPEEVSLKTKENTSLKIQNTSKSNKNILMKTDELLDLCEDYEFEKNFTIRVWLPEDIQSFLGIEDKEQFEKLISRTATQASRDSIKKAFNVNFIYSEEKLDYITTVGLFLLIKLNCSLVKYKYFADFLEFSTELAIFDLLRYQGLKKVQKKTKTLRSSQLGKTEEDILSYKTQKVSSSFLTPDLDIEDKSHLFYGKSVVLTGVFNKFSVRNEMAKWIKSVGGNNNRNVSSKTDFVVIGENPGPSKIEKIEKFGLKTLTEDEFLALFPDKTPS